MSINLALFSCSLFPQSKPIQWWKPAMLQGYFVPLAEGIKGMVKVPAIGVGNITEPEYADTIVREQRVDLVAFGRMLLSNPEFPKQAAQKLGMKL